MLERPAIPDSQIITCLRDEYGLEASQIAFLPIGADRDTAVFRATAGDASSFFVKLRRGVFDDLPIRVPWLLHGQGIEPVIAPLPTRSRQLWARLGDFTLAVFPFVEGRDGYETDLLDRHWVELGRALRALHTARLPAAVTQHIRSEDYADRWRRRVREFQAMVEDAPFEEAVAAHLAAFLKHKKDVIDDLIRRAERLASILRAQSNPFVLCHADLHAGNVLIDSGGRLFIVDWDTLVMAPKERDLMYAGGGQFLNWRSPHEEERLFYQGYGQTEINPAALAYYRYERIVEDIAAYAEEILLTDAGGADRAEGLRQLTDQFGPNAVLDVAYRTDRNPPELYQSDQVSV